MTERLAVEAQTIRPRKPDTNRRVRRNTFFKAVGESSRIFSIILFILIARFLGGTVFGSFSVALALAVFLATLADSGLNQLLIRDIAREQGRRTDRVDLTLSIKLATGPLVLILLCALSVALRYPPPIIRLTLLCGVIAVTKNFVDFCFAIFNGHELMEFESMLKGFNQLMALSLALVVLLHRGGILAVAGAMAAANLLTLCAAFVLLNRKNLAPRRILLQLAEWAALWKESLPLAVSYIFNALFFRIDVIMLSVLGSSAPEIGYFAAGTRVIEGIGTIPALLSMALFPIMADHGKSHPRLFVELFHRWRLYFLELGLLAAVTLLVVRKPLIYLTFGASFARTSFLLAYLAASIPGLFLNYWSINNLIVLGQQRYVAVTTISALAANAIFNLLLIPRWGAAGASVSVVIGQTVLCGIATFYLRHCKPEAGTDPNAPIPSECLP